MANEKRLIDAKKIEFPSYFYEDEAHPDPFIEGYRQGKIDAICDIKTLAPTVDAVEVEKYNALVEMYHDLRGNFIDYVCSGTCNVAPYCLNRCEGCVDRVGWCSQGSDECHGFNPAEVILDGDGNG